MTAIALLAACATLPPEYQEGRSLIEAGEVEAGLAKLEQAARDHPSSAEIRGYYFRQRELALQRLMALGDRARTVGQPEVARDFYRRALAIDPANARAKAGVEQAESDVRHRAALAEAEGMISRGELDPAQERLRAVIADNPGNRTARNLLRQIEERRARAAADAAAAPLAAALRKPITLEFREAPLRAVFDLISQRSGLNFIFDRDVPPDARSTILMRDTTIDDALKFLLLTNQLERKVLNPNTILVYPNTAAKARDYRELVVRSFYLSNADAKQTAAMLRTILRSRDLYVDEKLNMLVMRDSAEAVRMAERLIANQDLGEPEVMLEVEVLEVGANALTQIGVTWPGQLSLSLMGAANVAGQLTLREWLNRNAGLVNLSVSDPLFALNLQKQDGSTNVLANPRIRVKNREKARVHIGDRVPVITTTTTATGFAAETVTYLDVGLKLEVEPQVFLEDDVAIKVGLEVSNIAREIRAASGTVTYQVGTRNAATTLRLKDGETQVLAGLISDEDRRNATRVPGLGDLPVLGHLFSNQSDTTNRTEIVLLITPHVVRNIERPDLRSEQFSVGTESSMGGEPSSLPAPPAQPAAPPGVALQPAPAPGQPAPAPGQPAPHPGQPSQPAAPQGPQTIPGIPSQPMPGPGSALPQPPVPAPQAAPPPSQ